MKKLLAGAGLAAAIVSGAHMGGEVVAGAQASDICAPVFDSTNTGDQSVPLRDQIRDYADNGIEVHVQILEEGHSRGIDTIDDTHNFIERLADTCDWTDPDVLDVVVSFDPRAYDVYLAGQADHDIAGSTINRAEGDFVDNLRDTSTSTQSDVAKLLRGINPYDTPSDSVDNGAPDSATSPTSSQPFHMPDLPYRNIGLGALGAGMLAAGVARAKRGKSVQSAHADALNKADDALDAAMTASSNADEVLGIVPEGDALDSRTHRSGIDESLAAIVKAREATDDAYQTQRRRLWPDLGVVDAAAEELKRVSDATSDAAEVLTTGITELSGRIVTIDKSIEKFGGQITDFETTIAELEKSGWDISSYRDALAQFRKQQDDIVELRSQNYVDKPNDMIDELDDTIVAQTQRAHALPERFDTNSTTHTEQTTQIDEAHAAADAATANLQEMRDSYDVSCTQDIDDQDARLRELLEKLEQLNATVETNIVQQSDTAVMAVEKAQMDIQANLNSLDAGLKTIQGRSDLLAELSQHLPTDFAGLAEDARDGIRFARTNYGDDTEPETYDQMEALEQEIAEARRGLADHKPKLLELNSVLTRLGAKQDELDDRARSEAQEMKQLRVDSATLHRNIQGEMGTLKLYLASHSSDIDSSTRAAISSFTMPGSISSSLDRTGLRQQVHDLGASRDTIASLLSKAKRDVSDAEDDRRRAQLTSYSSSHHSASFPHSTPHIGGGGGGSHHSGGF